MFGIKMERALDRVITLRSVLGSVGIDINNLSVEAIVFHAYDLMGWVLNDSEIDRVKGIRDGK